MLHSRPKASSRGLLVDHLKVKKVFVGFDFAFGKGRAGGISLLKKLGSKYGFDVHAVRPFNSHGHLVKSSTIRSMIAGGEFNKAVKLLGHPYSIEGRVVKGVGRGRKLGFPTANISCCEG